MNDLKSMLYQAIAKKREITIIHKERGRIKILPLKIEDTKLIADITKAGLLGHSPEKQVRLLIEAIRLPPV